MAKKGRPSWLSPKKILSKGEFEKYKELRQRLQKRKLREDIKAYEKEAKQKRAIAKYRASRFGKVSRAVSGGLRTLQQPYGVTRFLYGGQQAKTSTTRRTERVGRPRGSYDRRTERVGRPRGSYDRRYARFGGVYGWRRYQAAQLRLMRLQAMRRAAVTPQQQEILNRIEARNRMSQLNVERKPIPDTRGQVPMKDFFDEIDNAANAVQ